MPENTPLCSLVMSLSSMRLQHWLGVRQCLAVLLLALDGEWVTVKWVGQHCSELHTPSSAVRYTGVAPAMSVGHGSSTVRVQWQGIHCSQLSQSILHISNGAMPEFSEVIVVDVPGTSGSQ